MIQNLLKEINLLHANCATTPSFLTLIGQERREMTHSAIIAELLNPRGTHNQGALFLEEFLNSSVLLRIIPFDCCSAKVVTEKDLGSQEDVNVGDEKRHVGGRADIYLEDKDGQIIVIENKIYASDQEFQLERYWNSTGRKGHIIYLTLDNRMPSKESLGAMWPSLVLPISYKDEIIEWLQNCMSRISDDCLKSIIAQYVETLKMLTKEFKEIETICSSSSNMAAAISVANVLDKARNKVTFEFMEQLANLFENRQKETSTDCEITHDSEGWHFFIEKYNIKIEFCVDWRLFIRIAKVQGIHLKGDWHEGDNAYWRYVNMDYENIDFHNFSPTALKFIDSPATTVNKVYARIKEILTESGMFTTI